MGGDGQKDRRTEGEKDRRIEKQKNKRGIDAVCCKNFSKKRCPSVLLWPVGVFYVNTFYTDHIQVLAGEQSGNWTLAIGYTDQGTHFQGNVKFWSRGVPEDKAGFMNIDVSFQL